jgi:hypothetical protein
MREISVGIKKAQVMAVWKNNGWIDEDNYGFQAGMGVKEPIITTKMIMDVMLYVEVPVMPFDGQRTSKHAKPSTDSGSPFLSRDF